MYTSRLVLRVLSFFLILSFASCSRMVPFQEKQIHETNRETTPVSSEGKQEIRALWVSQFDLSPICVNRGKQRERDDYIQRIELLLKNVCSIGINTLFVQVRPNGDSLCRSAIFPSSPYAAGTIGADMSYDPFGILLTRAHEMGLSVHAWINPLRAFTEVNRQTLVGDYPLLNFCGEALRGEGDPIVLWENVWYLNPADSRARALITEGVTEILRLYDVDGIHLDDYFYPTQDPAFDTLSFQREGNGLSLGDFRREKINQLMKELRETVKRLRPEALFGVSPGGNTQRNYHELFADVAAWCLEGSVDYICPQIYFGLEHETIPFESACREFSKMAKEGGVTLLVGMTLGKAYDGFYGKEDRYAGQGAREWIERTDVLSRCLTVARSTPEYRGVCFFSYQYFFSPEEGDAIDATARECASLLPLLSSP